MSEQSRRWQQLVQKGAAPTMVYWLFADVGMLIGNFSEFPAQKL
jgi:hypothetical protein